jgi:DNA excision repair protein ERCC-3
MMIKSLKEREWGLMILDEVHVAPAEQFQKVLQIVNSHCKLGLTATLVREDNKIKDLNFLVGPKLYEANWIDLTEQGFLARVKCVEVWCPMTKEFYAEYIKGSATGQSNSRLQRLLYNLNPTKFRTCEYLVQYHAARGDKIIIFSDDLPALILYCASLKGVLDVPYIYGETPHADRENILKLFKQRSSLCPCIGLSKVGDTALDIPEANVIIQVSSHFGARRQEAQRLGRILRPKSNPSGGFNAFFYTLVSTDTREMYFSTKRQQYLIDQGYTFQVVQDLAEKANKESKLLRTKSDEMALLNQVLKFNYLEFDSKEDRALARAQDGEDEEEAPSTNQVLATAPATTVSRKTASLGAKSGAADGKVYAEFSV